MSLDEKLTETLVGVFKREAMMAGQEYSERWNEEFDKLTPLPEGMSERGRGIEAAKRASGLEETS